MPKLRFISIKCGETEDNWGADDTYVLVNSVQVWGPQKMNDNQSRDLRDVETFKFTSKADIELWEVDDADPNDYLGTWVARAEEASRGEQTATFNADDCHYTMIYEVLTE